MFFGALLPYKEIPGVSRVSDLKQKKEWLWNEFLSFFLSASVFFQTSPQIGSLCVKKC